VKIAFLMAVAFIATVAPVTAETVDGNRIIVLDGDTVALPCASPAHGCAEKIRLLDIDAPETFRPDCADGLKAGLKAKARLAELIRGRAIFVQRFNNQRDRYGRTLAALRIGGPAGMSIGMQLVREELALPYINGQKEERRLFWCGPK